MKNINHRQHFWESTSVNNNSYNNPENLNTLQKASNQKGPRKGNTHHVLSKNIKDNKIGIAGITTEVNRAGKNPILNCRTVTGEKFSGEKKKNNQKVKNETFNWRITTDTRRNNAKSDTLVPHKKYGERKKLLEKRECHLNRESTKFQEKTDIENDASCFSNLITFDDQPTVSEKIPIKNNPQHGTHRDVLRKDFLENSLKNIHFDIHLDLHAGIRGIHTETVPEGRASCNGIRDSTKDDNRKTKHGPSGNTRDGENPPHDNNTGNMNFEKLNKEENAEKELLLEHIKRLEYQNNIFLNNLLNVYYVCMDYIKMQDEKIKKNEEIILFQNKIINDLKANEHFEDTTGMSNDITINCKNDDSDL
ncbi:conserved Plasmodium protein, unknown function [Plasmodium knowlesi strain H]|uniref:Uncharacterized protein n=3 Tax=Plasmodium knowlesi TaxID=5850 RepID=A0A5K1U5K2_PLAKH|nr:conserved Plasmodium protein, unknown function [Plasmodium knowlesi strain H]OTN64787.1 Uncharacterized protein PKNOH_S130183900 [Plasmodium knowlesi]CAA9989005.1 conserved Plasmodium protein, unknown function [Plasmodium knowlesi strain H]SBO24849.1 conserved Plasmodium protein, unknown function [Plasmodium knowlesi strain H]SBO27571.1 conserved Plasmodium protein, unknown function [Plasmodium knowlesi strain H]VVS78479.1 conserved Plasmodium protein, unknown function [Plasmodium knowlesi |eukprot:XP_002261353.1 hypothetical protein, conserved in Plasmodium species [Plasmodium knowlesi strain H]